MGNFDGLIAQIRDCVQQHKAAGHCREFRAAPVQWPPAGPRDIVLRADLALELGHPEQASVCFLIWSEMRPLIRDSTITLIGPDIPEADTDHLPFAKIVLAAVDPVEEVAAYERYRSMELARFDLALKGYMLRAASQYRREWSRISREAVANGFCFQILGSALLKAINAVHGVRAAEVIFVTRSKAAVDRLGPLAITAGRMIQAMNKMLQEHEADCRRCEFQDVCTKAAEMQALARTLATRSAKG